MKVTGDNKVVTFTRTEHDDNAEIAEVEKASEEDIRKAQEEEKAEVLEDDAEPDDQE